MNQIKTKENNDFYSLKRLNICLNVAEMMINQHAFTKDPFYVLADTIRLFFDTEDNTCTFGLSQNSKSVTLSVTSSDKTQIFNAIELKPSFAELLYPERKEQREQCKGQQTFSFIKHSEPTIEEKYQDEYYFEEKEEEEEVR